MLKLALIEWKNVIFFRFSPIISLHKYRLFPRPPTAIRSVSNFLYGKGKKNQSGAPLLMATPMLEMNNTN